MSSAPAMPTTVDLDEARLSESLGPAEGRLPT
jgi:hypothetical protein